MESAGHMYKKYRSGSNQELIAVGLAMVHQLLHDMITVMKQIASDDIGGEE